jgi:glycosidase
MRTVVYQAFARLFGNQTTANVPGGTRDQNGVGKFADFNEAALAGIRQLGATHLWFTGVIRHARGDTDPPAVVKGLAGSPYAVTDWYDLNDDLAVEPRRRHAEFDALLARTHAAGLKALIDFVPNHVARTYRGDLGVLDDRTQAFSPRNNFYYLPGQDLHLPGGNHGYVEHPARATGNDVFTAHPGKDDWYETVKLNYGVDYRHHHRVNHFDPVPDTWVRMRDILLYWVSRGVDGFRCDMAEMVPVEFWAWAIAAVKAASPGTLFIAEIYNPDAYGAYLDQGGFDLLYDKVGLYDAVRAVVEGKGTVAGIEAAYRRTEALQDRLLNFVENHDEQRVASPWFAGDPWRGLAAFTVAACLGRGAVMVYFGQEVGEPGAGAMGFSGDDGRTTIFDYWGVPEHQKWMNGGRFDGGRLSEDQKRLRDTYAQLLDRCRTDPALVGGTTRFLSSEEPTVLRWVREGEGRRVEWEVDLAQGRVRSTER